MRQLVAILCVLSCVAVFGLGPSLLDLMGWAYLSPGANTITKIHPSFYLLLIAAPLAIFSGDRRALATITRPSVIFYAFAALVITVRGAQIAASGVTGGELSIAIVTYDIPLLALIAVMVLDLPTTDKMALAIRIFFCINSLWAIGEQAIGHRIIPSYLDGFPSEHRSAALMGHPLLGSMFTGLYLVYVVTSGRRDLPPALRVGEMLLHVVAMFAFGGRSALVFTAATISLSALTASNAKASQRLWPLLIILLGGVMVFLPIPIVDNLIDRFTNDQGSAETRAAALKMITLLTSEELMYGISGPRRAILQEFLNTQAGIELSWVALIMTYGLIAVLPMAIALPTLLFSVARKLDRSAFFMALQFYLVTAGSQGLGGKGTLIAMLLVMMVCLARPERQARPAGAAAGLSRRTARPGLRWAGREEGPAAPEPPTVKPPTAAKPSSLFGLDDEPKR